MSNSTKEPEVQEIEGLSGNPDKLELDSQGDIPDASHVIDKKAERTLKLKSDFLLLPIMSLTYLTAYLVCYSSAIASVPPILTGFIQDRNNLGNAKIMTFAQDTHLTAQQFYNCLTIFCKSRQWLRAHDSWGVMLTSLFLPRCGVHDLHARRKSCLESPRAG